MNKRSYQDVFKVEDKESNKELKLNMTFENKMSQMMRSLEKDGYAIVENMFTKEQCKDYIKGIENFLINVQTNDNPNKKKIFENEGIGHELNIYRSHGAGHIKPLWDIRQVMKPVFQHIYNEEDLITSMCGFCYMNPKGGKFKTHYHTDLGSELNKRKGLENFKCYQSIINLFDNGPSNGGLIVFPGSHLGHSKFYEENKIKQEKNFYIYYTEGDNDNNKTTMGRKYLDNYKKVKINMKAGSFAIIDSRLAHGISPNKYGNRSVTYVSQIPANQATENEINLRKEYYDNKNTTSHWPALELIKNSVKSRYRWESGYLPETKEWKDKFNYNLNYEKQCLLVGKNNVKKYFNQ